MTKPGLLPKWLLIYTVFRGTFVVKEYNIYVFSFKTLPTARILLIYLTFILGITRLICARRMMKSFYYAVIALSFVIEGLFFLIEGSNNTFGPTRVCFEVFLALFTLVWMVFLYPYYLLDGKIKEKSN